MTEKIYRWDSGFVEWNSAQDGEPLFLWRDLIARDLRAIPETRWNQVIAETLAAVEAWSVAADSLEDVTQRVYRLFAPAPLPHSIEHDGQFDQIAFGQLPSFHLSGASIADRGLICAAVAYCLAYENGYATDTQALTRLRLAALTLELDEIARPVAGDVSHPHFVKIYARVREGATRLSQAFWRLARVEALHPESPAGDEITISTILHIARLIASNRLKYESEAWAQPDPLNPDNIEAALETITDKSAFASHPLVRSAAMLRAPRIALLLGGATKIKDYFLESARLPEIRGASTLLDRINLEDVPALFGDVERCADDGRREQIRQRAGVSMDAPECIIYANGGNVLAFAPPTLATRLAQEIENLYTRETLVANSVAVSQEFELLELHYGLRPAIYWADCFIKQCQNDELRPLVDPLYQVEMDGKAVGLDQKKSLREFLKKKCFGELGTALAIKQHARRSGNDTDAMDNSREVALRPLHTQPPHYEMLPQARRCSSCERRPAITEEPRDTEKYLCAACGRKRLAGRLSESSRSRTLYHKALKRLRDAIDWPPTQGDWMAEIGDWVDRFLDYLKSNDDLSDQYWKPAEDAYHQHGPRNKKLVRNAQEWVIPAQDLAEISDRNGFVGLIYADGNNVGSIIEQMQTATQYRQFAQQLFAANQRAVFQALVNVLRPHKRSPNEERPDIIKLDYVDREGRIIVHPFEILSIGGDDFMLFVPGEYALEVALQIGNNLENTFRSKSRFAVSQEGLQKRNRQPGENGHFKNAQRYRPDDYLNGIDSTQPAVSLSAGVVIADCHTPVYFMEHLARQLLDSAKRYAKHLKRDYGYNGGTVDFMALKSVTTITSEVGPFRESALEHKESGSGKEKLYARPYTLHELGGLMATVRAFERAQFPRSQLYNLRNDALNRHDGRQISTLNYLYFRARTKKGLSDVITEHLERNWHGQATELLYPWRRISKPTDPDQVFETLLYDLVEIYDFVAGGKTEDGNPSKQSAE